MLGKANAKYAKYVRVDTNRFAAGVNDRRGRYAHHDGPYPMMAVT